MTSSIRPAMGFSGLVGKKTDSQSRYTERSSALLYIFFYTNADAQKYWYLYSLLCQIVLLSLINDLYWFHMKCLKMYVFLSWIL